RPRKAVGAAAVEAEPGQLALRRLHHRRIERLGGARRVARREATGLEAHRRQGGLGELSAHIETACALKVLERDLRARPPYAVGGIGEEAELMQTILHGAHGSRV